jgi:hypothetical protein
LIVVVYKVRGWVNLQWRDVLIKFRENPSSVQYLLGKSDHHTYEHDNTMSLLSLREGSRLVISELFRLSESCTFVLFPIAQNRINLFLR